MINSRKTESKKYAKAINFGVKLATDFSAYAENAFAFAGSQNLALAPASC